MRWVSDEALHTYVRRCEEMYNQYTRRLDSAVVKTVQAHHLTQLEYEMRQSEETYGHYGPYIKNVLASRQQAESLDYDDLRATEAMIKHLKLRLD